VGMTWRRWWHAIPARFKAIVLRRRLEQDLDDELAFHVAMQTRANAEEGMTQTEAYRRARVEIGGVEQVKERSRDGLPLRWLRDAMQDIRVSLRGLRKSPRFTVAAVLTVVLGVGANATIFSVLNPLLFKPLPYPEAERIVAVFRTSPQSNRWPHSMANYLDHRARNTVFEHLAAVSFEDTSLAEPGQPAERLFTLRTSGNFFALFGVGSLIGRTYTDADDQTGANEVAVLSYEFWQRHFNGDPTIVGRPIRLNAGNTTVVGVMPRDFEYPLFWGNIDIWRPFAASAQQRQDRGNNFLREFGRLKPGVTPDQAEAAMKAINAQLLAEHTNLDRGGGIRLEGLSIANPVMRRVSAFAFGLTFLVLLIACVNLANLQLARTAARAREFAIRGAIGGGKARLIRQSLTDSLVLSIVGGAIAIPLSFWCTRLIATRQFAGLQGVRVVLEPATLVFAFGCAVLTGVIFGAVPAWLASRSDINDVLKQNPQSMTAGSGPRRFRHGLIVAEIAFALIILAGAVSLVRGLQRLTAVDPGWRVDGVLTARLNVPQVGPSYTTPEARRTFFQTLRDRVAEIPGVTHAAVASSSVPTATFSTSTSFVIEGRPDPVLAYNERVTPEYFETLEVPLRRGRLITADDRFGRAPVMVINEAMARAIWPGEDPIGKRVGNRGPNPNWREVVGVVGDITFPSFGASSTVDTQFQTFQPLAQTGTQFVNILLRTEREGDAITAELRRIVAALDRDLPVYGLMTARAAERRQTANLQLLANVLAGFAGLGLLLAALGIFGVVSYSTAQRASELGMRMALGARQSAVLWLVLKQGVRVIAAGAIAGLVGGFALGRVLSSMLPNLPSPEVAILLGAFSFMVLIALAAFFIPAWRASKTNPMLVLRHE
jgi:putative ABC transport system permease protein